MWTSMEWFYRFLMEPRRMSKEEVKAVLRSFGMGKFAGAVMFVLHEAIENEECRNNVRRPKGKQMSVPTLDDM